MLAWRATSPRPIFKTHTSGGLAVAAVFLLAAFSPPAAAAGDEQYLAELQQSARAARLAAQPYWHKLVHYERNALLPGVTSSVDDADFFLAAAGKTDPDAELDATLASFFTDAPRLGEPPQCRARARYEWLRGKLAFDPARLPPQRCEKYEQWLEVVRPSAVALVFAANDLASPATMFGHTLLRVDRVGQGEDERLLAKAVNYAAEAPPMSSEVGYIIKALAAQYQGEYAVYPYHERVREYARVDYRDLWEYPVKLAPEEIERVFAHLWEMREVGSDYLFFTENCAYMLLALLDTANDAWTLPREFDDAIRFVIPVDTVRAARDAGVLGEPVFRPSQARTLTRHFRELPAPHYRWVLEYARGDATLEDPRHAGAAERDRARMLEAAADYLLFLHQNGALDRGVAIPRARAALSQRSALAARSEFAPVPRPAVSPDRGHESSRFALGARRDEDDTAAALRIRAAYHDRLDPTAGFPAGGEIEFAELALLAGDDDVQVSELKVVGIQSVTPWDRAFRPWLWQAQTGLRRYGLDALAARHRGALGGYLDFGFGFAAGDDGRAVAYGFGLVAFDANRDVRRGHALSGGLRAGLWLPWSGTFIQQLETDVLGPVAGGARHIAKGTFATQWQLGHDDGLRLLLSYGDQDDAHERSVELRWQRYF
jgi:hypothetical protein